jgi:hypothetical protein
MTTSPADARPSMIFVLFHGADGEAGEVVFAVGVHARHLRGLAADQRTAGQFAAACDALGPRLAAGTSSLPQAK